MGINLKKSTKDELDRCDFYIKNPTKNKGNWKTIFKVSSAVRSIL